MRSAFVRKAAAAGAKIFFTFHQNQSEAAALTQLGAEGFALDLLDMKQIEAFCAAFKTKVGHLDVLIHNAAAIRDHTIQNMTEEDWDTVMTTNLKAPYYLTKKLLSLLFKKVPGTLRDRSSRRPVPAVPGTYSARKIFFLTSRVAMSGGFGVANYAAAKAGVNGLMKSLAQELGKKQILVNAVNPGFMKSSMTENLPEDVICRNLEASPLGRFSDPEEVADFLLYLCSDRVTQVTGQILHFESRKI